MATLRIELSPGPYVATCEACSQTVMSVEIGLHCSYCGQRFSKIKLVSPHGKDVEERVEEGA